VYALRTVALRTSEPRVAGSRGSSFDSIVGGARRSTTAPGLGDDPEQPAVEVWYDAWRHFVEEEREAADAPATTLEDAMRVVSENEREAAIATFKKHNLEWSHYVDLFLVSGLLAKGSPFRVDLDDPVSVVARAMLDAPLDAPLVVQGGGGGGAATSFVAALSKRAEALHRIGATSAKLRRLAPSLRAHLDESDL